MYFLFLYAIYVFCCLTIVSFKRKWEGIARMRFSRATYLHTKPIMYFVCFFTLFFLSKAQTYLYIIIFQPNCYCSASLRVVCPIACCTLILKSFFGIFIRTLNTDFVIAWKFLAKVSVGKKVHSSGFMFFFSSSVCKLSYAKNCES